MKRFMIFAAFLIAAFAAKAQDAPSPNLMNTIQKAGKDLLPAMPSVSMPSLPAMPTLSLPTMPDLSMPDFSRVGEGIMGEFNTFTQQVADSLPILEEMGYEVSTFRVQWGLPPKAKLRLRSKSGTNPDKIGAIAAKATGGMLMTALISSAARPSASRAA